jgi:hypothetical protein
MKRQLFSLSTDTAGAATSGQSTTNAQPSIFGELCAIKYVPGTIDTGATITVTCVAGDGSAKALLTKATAGTSNVWFYPRDLVHAVSDGAALTGTSGGDRTEPILDGQIKVVVASGGAVKLGSVTVYYED